MTVEKEWFPITRLHRDDVLYQADYGIYSKFIRQLSDDEMQGLANKIGQWSTGSGVYWDVIDEYLRDMKPEWDGKLLPEIEEAVEYLTKYCEDRKNTPIVKGHEQQQREYNASYDALKLLEEKWGVEVDWKRCWN